jgi:hypothetical protein
MAGSLTPPKEGEPDPMAVGDESPAADARRDKPPLGYQILLESEDQGR